MGNRMLVWFCAVATAILYPALAAGQTAAGRTPRTPDGHPDLQGNWVNKSATPLERPEQLKGRQFLTATEVADMKTRAGRIFKDTNSDFATPDNFFLAALANVEKYKSVTATGGFVEQIDLEFDNRTSLIVDPPDGRIPPYTPAGERRLAALQAATLVTTHPAITEDLTSFQRCITWGVPMPRAGAYTSYYQIVQTPDYAMLLTEVIHDARIIPLDNRPHLPADVRAWHGDSIGHWEGETLVVDTTNFSPKSNFMGSRENLHLVERFTRVASDQLGYEITVIDLTTWTKPWTMALRLKQTEDRIHEFACHEGNFRVMEGMFLRGPA